MSRAGGASMTWQEELASLMEDSGVRYSAVGGGAEDVDAMVVDGNGAGLKGRVVGEDLYRNEDGVAPEESLKDQMKGFLKASIEMMTDFGRGCSDIVQQSLVGVEDSYIAKRLRGPLKVVSTRLRFLNDYLPEDRDPVHSWLVILCVFLFTLPALIVNSGHVAPVQLPKTLYVHPPNASLIQLPDGRFMAYKEQGVSTKRARFTMIAPHSFLSSRLAGIPGIKESLLEEFGVRFITYDLPGFGESDPHPSRNLNSSAIDMLHLANAVGVMDKFWVLGYSGGGMHAWAAVRYIPHRLAGVAMFAPMINPYDYRLNKEDKNKIWEKWTAKRKFVLILAKRFLLFFLTSIGRSFLSGTQGQLEKWLSISLGKKDKALIEGQAFHEFWERDVAESIRQMNPKPFVQEAVLQVSNWGFSLADLQVRKKLEGKSLLLWLKSIYIQSEGEWTGFLGPIHIWQGMDDQVVPPPMTEFIRRLIPGATVHRLLGEGHFSYYCFCDNCHRQIFSTIFGTPQGPLDTIAEDDQLLLPPTPEALEEDSTSQCSVELE
ncbi:hypothetical protein HPP92_013892 [Vanilla planifolia]|uniref:AB hydrolase-1 domain-containing protein n=1 Tax=Vanilla planifolia TaxID=51239 RepID=A0A835QP93_VANPL|nr:hypothetical protein HPP92_013892 [Vanilla planifolia]